MYTLVGPALSGFLLGLSLIVAIGAQNAFILRMGLLRSHVFWLCLFCALSDALLIVAGISGMGAFVDSNPEVFRAVALAGAAFLFGYAGLAFYRVFRPQQLEASGARPVTLVRAIAICAGLTFLNPHVYLDTVVLVGAFAARYEDAARIAFGAGAVTASFVWFFCLGYGARILTPVFRNPRSWQVLDALIAVIMAALAAKLLLSAIQA
jgi:L-lysine exporter family protein LysE/ArgO